MNQTVYPSGDLDASAFIGFRVLLVDEDVQGREFVGNLLEAHGADVTIAPDTYNALRIFAEHRPDLIVADVSPPSVSGLALLRKVRRLPATLGGQTPAIAVSRLTHSRVTVDSRGAGFQAHLVKPVNAEVLVSTVQRLKDQIRSARRLREETKALRSELEEQRVTARDRKARLFEQRERLSRLSDRNFARKSRLASSDRVENVSKVPRANRVLSSMPVRDAAHVRSRTEAVTLYSGDNLYFLGDRIAHVYFPESAVVSLLCVLPEGPTVELGIIGFEGIIGAALSSRDLTARFQPHVQLGGLALRMEHSVFERELELVPSLGVAVRGYLASLFNEAARTAACNRFHTLEQRLCRWLLAIHDRAESDELSVTHATISHALGVRRAGVTVALGVLQRAHAISVGRARITIVDRWALEMRSCRCYTPIDVT